ncbi:MAG: F0F1 ATP synthase subunit delta [Campylobacterota bacterium]|nr:F0F1 ATP synthase subunit delta [Campylobacterota bacterium]
MEELIAKRYIKALKSNSDLESMTNITTVFSALADSFKDEKFVQVIDNPNVQSAQKQEILLEAVKSAKSNQIDNLIKLLVENKRINIIPAIAVELVKDVANSTKTYTGVISSNSDIDVKVVAELSSGLSKRFDANITLTSIKNDFNGIKVDVEGLGIEINFSKDRIDSQIIEHIIKAI